MNCPKCKFGQHTKDHKTQTGKQRYKYKNYNCHFSVEKRCTEKSDEQNACLALQLYLEELGFRAIDRVLNISYGTAFQWVKNGGISYTSHQ